MTPAIWSSYYIDLTPEEMVAELARAHWLYSELSDEHGAALLGRGDPVQVGREFGRMAREQGVTFPQGHLWLAADIAGEQQGQTVDRLRGWLDLFQAVGVRCGVLHPGGGAMRKAGCSAEEVFDARVAALSALCEHVRGSEFVICLENIWTTAPLAGDLLALIEAVGSEHLGICLDTGHLNLVGGEQGIFVRRAAGALKALHLADNDGSGDQHLMPFARGTVRWAELTTALREIGYAGLLNFEIPGENRCPLAIRRAKLVYLKSVAEYLVREAP
jgi:sugar phosphate isomerase/epimerase